MAICMFALSMRRPPSAMGTVVVVPGASETGMAAVSVWLPPSNETASEAPVSGASLSFVSVSATCQPLGKNSA